MRLTYRPLTTWPGKRTPVGQRTRSRFRASWHLTLNALERELRMLGADVAVLETGFRESDIRLDGLPRAGARPQDEGIILSFESKYGPLRYACDTYWTWQENLRAITLGLEALRAVDRYGVTKRGEQYTGWKALADGSQSAAEAKQWIAEHGGTVAAALKITHPDHGGTAADLNRTLEARRILEPVQP